MATHGDALITENVQFHGFWLAKYMITEKLIRSIGQEFSSKPARASRFSLSHTGVTLEVLPTTDGKPGRVDRIAFENLRDVTFNRHNMKCLMVVYLDAKNMFSIMVCSSGDERAALSITRAYKDHKNSLLLAQSTNTGPERNWTLRQQKIKQQQQLHVQADVRAHNGSNGVDASPVADHHDMATNGTDPLDDDIFMMDDDMDLPQDTEEVTREPVTESGDSDNFNVGTQTAEFGSDTDSMLSSDSLQSLRDDLHSLSEEMKAIKFLLEKSTGISSEEYYRRRDWMGNRHAVAFHSKPRLDSPASPDGLNNNNNNNHENTDSNGNNNNNSNTNGKERVRFADTEAEIINGGPMTDEDEDYDLRSVGMQTDRGARGGSINRTRYLKRQANGSSSNVYKDKQTSTRKRISTASTSSSLSVADSSSSLRGGSLRASSVSGTPGHHRYSTGSWGPRSASMKTTSHVSRPIENVYHQQGTNYLNTGSRGFNNRRNNKMLIRPVSATLPPAQTNGSRLGSTSSQQSNHL